MFPQEKLAESDGDSGLRLAIKQEFHWIIGGGGGPEPIDHPRAFEIREYEVVALLPHIRIFSGEPVIVAARAVVTGNGRHSGDRLENRQQIQALHGSQTNHGRIGFDA